MAMTYYHFIYTFMRQALHAAVAGILLCLAAMPARAQERVTQATAVTLKDGNMLQVCEAGGSCQLNRHPAAAGKVREIVAGDFVNAAQASWIALAERAVSLCYLNGASGAITCAPIANGADFARATRISSVSLDDGSHTLKFAAKNGNQAGWEANYSPYVFMSSLSAAADMLTQHAARHAGSKANLSNPAAANGDGADLCASSAGGGVTCTGTDAQAPAGNSAGAGAVVGQKVVAQRSAYPVPVDQADTTTITPVEVGKAAATGGTSPNRACDGAMNEQIAACNDMGRRFGERSREACINAAESNFQECQSAPRAGAN
jgi:hypothetical protein